MPERCHELNKFMARRTRGCYVTYETSRVGDEQTQPSEYERKARNQEEDYQQACPKSTFDPDVVGLATRAWSRKAMIFDLETQITNIQDSVLGES